MRDDLSELATELALENKWEDAIEINKKILCDNPEDVDCLNRLARAYFEAGNNGKAIKISKQVIKIEPYNNIAIKSLQKYQKVKPSGLPIREVSTDINFIEEPGKTKIIKLLNLGKEKIVSYLDAGDEIVLSAHSHRVSVNTLDGKYIGRLPDDISAKIRIFKKNGDQYKAIIKSAEDESVKIFIRLKSLSKNSPQL